MDNYEELLDFIEEWTAEEFFGGITIDNMQDEILKEKFSKADESFWDLKNYLERKI